jgi:hypothetical protein
LTNPLIEEFLQSFADDILVVVVVGTVDQTVAALKTEKGVEKDRPGNAKGGSITVPLTSCLTGLESAVMTTDNFCFYLTNRLIQTSQTGGQWYCDTSPLSIP